MVQLFFVVGATNAGKSTFLQAVKDACGGRAGLVEVGKWMRAKYPPEHFNGQGAPANTAGEAWAMLVDGISKASAAAEFVLIDGQPRDLNQCDGIRRQYDTPEYQLAFIHLYASAAERKKRALGRDPVGSAALDLALARVVGDVPPLYDVTSWLTSRYMDRFFTLDTASENYDPYASFVHVRAALQP